MAVSPPPPFELYLATGQRNQQDSRNHAGTRGPEGAPAFVDRTAGGDCAWFLAGGARGDSGPPPRLSAYPPQNTRTRGSPSYNSATVYNVRRLLVHTVIFFKNCILPYAFVLCITRVPDSTELPAAFDGWAKSTPRVFKMAASVPSTFSTLPPSLSLPLPPGARRSSLDSSSPSPRTSAAVAGRRSRAQSMSKRKHSGGAAAASEAASPSSPDSSSARACSDSGEEAVNSLARRIMAKAGRGTSQLAGVIVRVTMENFMCHQNVSCELNPRVSFITGKNGSGKSAILTAIVVCFGTSARDTSRAKALKDFIRRTHGSSAHVSVTLQNVGPEAFRPEVYGRRGQALLGASGKKRQKTGGPASLNTSARAPTLTIKRTINQSGSSSYSLYDTNGTKIKPSQFKYGSAKGEVEAIKDKFNLQVGNPCCVLDQETSKKFLRGDAKEKYEFFANATLIQKLEREFATHGDQVRLVESRLKQTTLRVAQLKTEFERSQRQLDDLNEVANADKRLQDAKGRQAWFEVKKAA